MNRALPMIGALGLAAIVGACGDGANREVRDIEVRSEQQEALFELSPVNRDIAMRRAITGAGFTCDRVVRSGYAADWQNTMMWTATCDDDRRWAIFVGADDTAQVRACEDVEAAPDSDNLPDCEITRADTQGINTPEVSPIEPGSNEPDAPEADANS